MSTRSELSAGARLYALLAAIKRSPSVVRLAERLLPAPDWASVRKSPDVVAYVLAWMASHVRGAGARGACSCSSHNGLAAERWRRAARVSHLLDLYVRPAHA